MSEQAKHALNLDELFGTEKTITVDWDGKNYPLKNPQSFGPKEFATLERMQKRLRGDLVEKIKGDEEITDDLAADLEKTVDQIIEMINPGLLHTSKPIPFAAKQRILNFYHEETSGKAAEGAKEEEKNSTGA